VLSDVMCEDVLSFLDEMGFLMMKNHQEQKHFNKTSQHKKQTHKHTHTKPQTQKKKPEELSFWRHEKNTQKDLSTHGFFPMLKTGSEKKVGENEKTTGSKKAPGRKRQSSSSSSRCLVCLSALLLLLAVDWLLGFFGCV